MSDYSSQLEALRTGANNEELTFPMLVWSDTADRSEIFLVTNAQNIKPVNHSKSGNIVSLLDKIAELTHQADPLAGAHAGDELQYPVDFIEFDHDFLDWSPLLQNISQVIETHRNFPPGLEPKVMAELDNFFIQDVTASSLDAVYNSIVYYLATLANELGVRSLGIVGELAYNDRFRMALIKHLNEAYEIRFAVNSLAK